MGHTLDQSPPNVDRVRRSGVLVAIEDAPARDDERSRKVLDALPAAVYVTDAAGLITYYNEAAVRLWGRRPELYKDQWSGAWKLFRLDGRPLPHDQSPMATALRESRPVRGSTVLAERPDGTRVAFIPYPTPLYDASGALIGAVNMLVDVADHIRGEEVAQLLASIVESSDDAIISKDLNGVIMSWNRGAERLFGYTAEEVIGKPVSILIPQERENEEPGILQRIRRGEKVDHYETVRRCKDGSLLDISLTVSPVRNSDGKIVGASKVARDITERRRAQTQQKLILREMDHRIKNLFSLAIGVVNLSARSARTPKELTGSVVNRLAALARAHALTISIPSDLADSTERPTTLHTLIKAIASPFESENESDEVRVAVTGYDIPIDRKSVTSLALIIHEFATNSAKYGALSTPHGHIDICCLEDNDDFILTWNERGGPPVDRPTGDEGFGGLLIRTAVEGQLGGTIVRDWRPDGLTIRVSVARDRLTA
jgi:PAS domain S-box-containing protein